MEYITVLKANLKRYKGSLIGVFILILVITVSMATVMSFWKNSNSYMQTEMNRMGFGDITAWVSDVSDVEELSRDISNLWDVEQIGIQNIVYSDYSIAEEQSDSEGQLITYDPENYPYKIFNDTLSGYKEGDVNISPGEIYIAPSLSSMFDVQIGDEINFSASRQGVPKVFIVKGYFEDPFMGSSMIGMKSFLINEQDSKEIVQMSEEAGIDSLARSGYMLHIFQEKWSTISSSEFNILLNEQTNLQSYVEFVHSNTSILGFMLILQNAFSGILIAFVGILIIVSMIVLGHNINSAIDQDYVNMGILKTIGFTGMDLKKIQISQYLCSILSGMFSGLLLSLWFIKAICRMTITTTGILIPTDLPIRWCIFSFSAVLGLLIGFIYIKIMKIDHIAPMIAIRGEVGNENLKTGKLILIKKKGLYFWMAIRQLITGQKKYISVCIVAILLVFFASLVGRMDSWLGPNGEGMMDAFNPAEHDIGVQAIGDMNNTEIENMISKYTDITDSYELAMPKVTVNGIDYTANVISEPERFHIQRGRTSSNDNEIVVTEFVAKDLNVDIGDTVHVAYGTNSREYIVSGIYQCANDMGDNIGMSKEGYDLIGTEDPHMWCHHYFLADTSQKQTIIADLEDTYGGDVHIHENSWPGLYGIISAMHMLILFMYSIVAIFIMIVVALAGSKILTMEQKDLGIYKSLGFTNHKLRLTFAMRFGVVSFIGSVIGMILSALLTDPLVSMVLKLCGISNFASHPGIIDILLPAVVVVGLFTGFAYCVSKKIAKVDLSILISE